MNLRPVWVAECDLVSNKQTNKYKNKQKVLRFMIMKLFHGTISCLYSAQINVIILVHCCASCFSVLVIKCQDQGQRKEESVVAYGSGGLRSIMACWLEGKTV